MKLKRLLCCVLSSVLLSVPFISGCSSSETQGGSIFDTSNAGQTVSHTENSSSEPAASQPVPTESSVISEPSITPVPSSSQPSGDTVTPALWKAEDRSGHFIYLMGSIHMGDEAVNNMPDYVNTAFDYCDSLAVEADIDSILKDTAKLQELAMTLIYTDGTTIQDHLSPETYNGVVSLLQSKNAYQAQYEYCKPFMWQSILSTVIPLTTNLDVQHGVDMIFLQKAKSMNKQILEVENIDFQINMFNNFSDGLNDLMLSEYLKPNYSQASSDYLNKLYSMWKQGNIDDSLILSGTFLDPNNTNYEYMQEYYDKLIKERNQNMVKTIEGYIDNGQKVFVLVGAFHYCGNDGIIALLQNDGYTVSRVA